MIVESDIRKAANKVLSDYKNKYGKIQFPINPFRILRSVGCQITFSDFDGLEGSLILDEANPLVSINKNRRIRRQRFTAAHEMGHIALHTDMSQKNFLCPKYGYKKEIEKEADKFASYLLMPDDELGKIIDKYKNSFGMVGFDECLYIAEYFGVSFRACVNAVAYRMKKLYVDYIDSSDLSNKITGYKPDTKRKELLLQTNDLPLICNTIDYCNFQDLNLSNNIGIRFVQNLVYHDSRIEKLDISREQVSGIFADLRYNGKESRYFKESDINIIESLGNIEMINYVLTTDERPTIYSIKKLNSIFSSFMPFPEYSGIFRNVDNTILSGSIQPITHTEICNYLDLCVPLLDELLDDPFKFSISDYLKKVAIIHYKLTIIHPFNDGNGRVIRAFTNWLLVKRNIPPFYIDSSNRDKYLEALRQVDLNTDYDSLVLIFIQSIINTITELHSI